MDYFQISLNGDLKPRIELISTLCLNNCSTNGICTDSGQCECYLNYFGPDCSLTWSSMPKIESSSYSERFIDLSIDSLIDIFIYVTDFAFLNQESVIKCSILVNSNINFWN